MSNLFLILVFMISANISGAVVNDICKLLDEIKEDYSEQQEQDCSAQDIDVTYINNELKRLIEQLDEVNNLAETGKIINDFAQIARKHEEKCINMHNEYAEKLAQVQTLKEKISSVVNKIREALDPSEEFKKQVFEFLRKIDVIKSHNLHKKTEKEDCKFCGKNKGVIFTGNKIYPCDSCRKAICRKCSTKDRLFLHNFPNNKEMVEILGLNKFLITGTLCSLCNNELRSLLEKMKQNNEYTFEQFKFYARTYLTYNNLYQAVQEWGKNVVPNLRAREELLLGVLDNTNTFIENFIKFREKSADLVKYFNPPVSTLEKILAGLVMGEIFLIEFSPPLHSLVIRTALTKLLPFLCSEPSQHCLSVVLNPPTELKNCSMKEYLDGLALALRITKMAEECPKL